MRKRGVTLGEAVGLALPFGALLLAYGVVTGKVDFSQGSPVVEMRAGFWLPVIFCFCIYICLLLNLNERRKGTWNWAHGLAQMLILAVLWFMISPIYDNSLWQTERHKLGVHY
ncbi:hypothetical protein IAD21_00694 [Abditibacteriota bacterium]|nr:hypothetical protein IAD21_00694 [Abditibacteriota bacterium]